MTAQLIPFSFESHEVRAFNIDGNPWFVGKDVCDVLGYANAADAIKQHCRGVAKYYPIVDRLGRTQEVRIINEPDLYRVIVGSNKPEAERFEAWVFEDVLPTIRQTGRYEAPEAAESPGLTSEQWAILRDLMYDISRYCNHREQAHFAVNERLRFQFGLRSSSELRPEHFEEARTDLEGLHVLAKHHRDQLIALDHEFITAVLRPPVSVRKVRAMAKKQPKLPPLSF